MDFINYVLRFFNYTKDTSLLSIPDDYDFIDSTSSEVNSDQEQDHDKKTIVKNSIYDNYIDYNADFEYNEKMVNAKNYKNKYKNKSYHRLKTRKK